MTSIRLRLRNFLFILLSITAIGMTVLTYQETAHEIEELFDAQIAQQAGIISELTLDALTKGEISSELTLSQSSYGHKYERNISFQIWHQNQLVFRSQNAPQARMSPINGFSDQYLGDEKWRIFSLYSQRGDYYILLGEKYDVRNELLREIVLNTIVPFLLIIPLVLLMLGWVIKRALTPLTAIASQVRQRNALQLSPIDDSDAPVEIHPLTHAVNELLNRLEHAFEKERHFTADAAHELRTPIAGIKVQAQIAKSSNDVEEREKALNHILQGVNNASHLIEQMLTLARLEPDMVSRQFSPFKLSDPIQEAISEVVGDAVNKDIELSFENQLTDDCLTTGYSPAISIMVRNLLSNAIRYTPKQGEITVSASLNDGYYSLKVDDSGSGISSSEQERIIDRFYRQAGQSNYGSGLGLAIVKQIVDLHRGDIELSKSPLGGLRVSIRLPAAML